jgi:inositol transport system substrate-binding protein
MRSSRIIVLAAALLFSQLVLAEYRIGVTIAKVDDNFMTYIRNGLMEAAKKENIQIQFQDAQGDVVRQLSQVEDFLSQKVDAVIVLPADTAGAINITRAATKAKIPLIYVNRRPDQPDLPAGVAAVTSDDIEAGQLQMNYLAQKMGGKGNLAIIMGDLVNNATKGRTDGVKQVLKQYPDIKVIDEQSALWQRDKAMDLTSNWLLAGTKIDAVVANNDEMAIGAAMAMKQAGQASIPIVGIDGLPDGLAAIERGQLAASVFQDPKAQASTAISVALKMIKGEPFEANNLVPFKLIKPDQVSTFAAYFK